MSRLLKIISLYVFLFFSNLSLAELNIVASIKPLFSLVTNVSGDKNQVKLLINGIASPHHYQLKPSDIKMLHDADVIFIIDENFESFLMRYLSKNTLKAKIVKLSQNKKLNLLDIRHKDELLEHAEHNHQHDHHHGNKDLHYWSDPFNATQIVLEIAHTLSELDPQNKEYYNNNTYKTVQKLDKLDKEVAIKLEPIKNKNFIVFHDAYQYFERRYNLSNVGTIVVGNNMNYGAKTVTRIQQIIRDKKVVCIFAEPQFSTDVVRKIATIGKIKYNYLDVEWGVSYSGLKPEDYYFAMMKHNANNLVDCLS